MDLTISHRPTYAPSVEFVERKGVGHPDTICDAMADNLARRMATAYIENTGAVQHFNVDKAILAAGTVNIEYGGGTHLTPGRLILVGKANTKGWEPDMDALVKAAHADLAEILPEADSDAYTIEIWLSQSADDLAVVNSHDVPLSNDTSFAAVSVPRSPLEETVYRVEHLLNGSHFRGRVPVGRDIKVMGARTDAGTTVTVASPIYAVAVKDRAEYDAAIDTIRSETLDLAESIMETDVAVQVNGADDDYSTYLTLSGTSAESGDDGQVGRGNRFGGLITPYRPMSLEAAAGKNPAAHVGKTYHAAAFDLGMKAVGELGASEVTTRILSSIGKPVTEPQAIHVEVHGDVDDGAIAGAVKESLSDWEGIRDRLIAGEYELY
ncbi:MAG: methionine adenosyltransferase [Acidimicrobiia bacterium]